MCVRQSKPQSSPGPTHLGQGCPRPCHEPQPCPGRLLSTERLVSSMRCTGHLTVVTDVTLAASLG